MRHFALSLVTLAGIVSCGYPPLPPLVDGDNGSSEPLLKLLAGGSGGPGYTDETGADARFNSPVGAAVDGDGNVYVGDTGNHTIRKITPAGVVTTLAGMPGVFGKVDGMGTAALFREPRGVAADNTGNVYVADAANHVIRKITPAGVVTTFAGDGSFGSTDGPGAAASFSQAGGVTVDSARNVYVADTSNHTIRKITQAGVVTTLAGTAGSSGIADGTGATARFYSPGGVAVDGTGNVYVADTGNHTIRKITPAGVVTTLAGTAGSPGIADGMGATARFTGPGGVAVDSAGTVYVADSVNATIRKITSAGIVTTVAGTVRNVGSDDGTGTAARFFNPSGLAVDNTGLYVADRQNNAIRKVTLVGVVTTLAGMARSSGSMDGTGPAARFNAPQGVTVDSTGNFYVTDAGNDTIRKVTSAGVVTTFAGIAGTFGSVDGTGKAARFNVPAGVAIDGADNVYVADSGNHTIRKVTPAGVVTTLAGMGGSSGGADGTGAAARFYGPAGTAVDGAGNLYVADSGNHTIRKITPAGVVTTFAGTVGSYGSTDGTGAAARFTSPRGVAVDHTGNVYVADTVNDTIRKITPAGVVTTLAGMARSNGSADGMGAAARFNGPTGVMVDSAGNAYVADNDNSTIRKITPAGVVTTLAGTAGLAEIVLGSMPGFASPISLAIVDDSLVIIDNDAVLLFEHGAR